MASRGVGRVLLERAVDLPSTAAVLVLPYAELASGDSISQEARHSVHQQPS